MSEQQHFGMFAETIYLKAKMPEEIPQEAKPQEREEVKEKVDASGQ